MLEVLLLLEIPSDVTLHYVIYALMTIIIVFLFTRKSYRPKAPVVLTPQEINELITTWEPTPLICNKVDEYQKFNIETVPVVKSVNKELISIEGYDNLINFGTSNYLGLAQGSELIEPSTLGTLHATGLGSCGPRNFYGTLDVHLDFESRMAKFLNVDSAILYSSSIATCASVIPTFSARGDYILSDERVRKSIQVGNYTSRSNVTYFRHNDLNHVEELMIQITKNIQKSKQKEIRRFIVVEGVYQNYGTMCRLREIIALAKQYKFRVILDDSVGLGALGATGRGTLEYLGMKASDVHVYCADISTSLGSLGGVCCGEEEMVRVQRLNGSGYMYSASNPPYLCTAGMVALNTIDEKPEVVQRLQKNSVLIHKLIKEIPQIETEGFDECPFLVFRIIEKFRPDSVLEEAKLYQRIVEFVREKGAAISRTKYTNLEKYPPPPQIKVSVMSEHSEEQIRQVASAIKEAINTLVQ
mmetsp:Transcript_6117/g.12855  ORF Transcript_6117/g.12855 Transcript_6117/m.12855 type:complete len:471 (+) Transcript_6117:43-1455(+)